MNNNESFLAAFMRNFLNPVVFIAVSILVSVFVLIGAAILGWDKGVLENMSKVEYARGLITYLFAIVTIGTAVVLVVSALTGADDPQNERRFERGKEILSLLLGVFGAIVGFYFGSEVSSKNAVQEQLLRVIPLRLNISTVAPKSQFTLMTYISGGKAPYRYGIALGSSPPEATEQVDSNGWITATVSAPDTPSPQKLPVKLVVKDEYGHEAEASTSIEIAPPK
jgi:uncharacterized membrane protein